MKTKTSFKLFIAFAIAGLIISAINPHEYFTWILEVFPAIIAIIILVLTYKSFPFSNLVYLLILIHCCILYIGGHYTYAEVPLFNHIRDLFHQQRNNYDRLGHFAQGFIPAIIAREILIRKQVLNKPGWRFYFVVSICLAISAFYELIEAFVSMTSGSAGDAFLGTQGDIWDTQWDMFSALIGAIVALIIMPKLHNKYIKKLTL